MTKIMLRNTSTIGRITAICKCVSGRYLWEPENYYAPKLPYIDTKDKVKKAEVIWVIQLVNYEMLY